MAETPAERAQALSQLLPQVSTAAQTIAHDYYLNKYSRGDDIPDEKRARFAAFQVKRVTRHTWWQRITHFWQKTAS
jgi:ABC-type nitrate/sulfonate/bicarbonate transport system substrate-binding protein